MTTKQRKQAFEPRHRPAVGSDLRPKRGSLDAAGGRSIITGARARRRRPHHIMPETKITLAGRDYGIRPLTLRQLRDLGICLARGRTAPTDAAAAEQLAYDNMIETVAAALARDHPAMTGEAILDLEVTLAELQRANLAILEHSGLVVAAGKAAAEASAATSA
jgi:hypothetical protein